MIGLARPGSFRKSWFGLFDSFAFILLARGCVLSLLVVYVLFSCVFLLLQRLGLRMGQALERRISPSPPPLVVLVLDVATYLHLYMSSMVSLFLSFVSFVLLVLSSLSFAADVHCSASEAEARFRCSLRVINDDDNNH